MTAAEKKEAADKELRAIVTGAVYTTVKEMFVVGYDQDGTAVSVSDALNRLAEGQAAILEKLEGMEALTTRVACDNLEVTTTLAIVRDLIGKAEEFLAGPQLAAILSNPMLSALGISLPTVPVVLTPAAPALRSV